MDVLSFAGIAPPSVRVYPVETHIAEKLHAYTMPRARPNSRVKDLPDIALLSTIKGLDARRLREALEQTSNFRKTHALPTSVPLPPIAWEKPYAALAREAQFASPSIEAAHAAVAAFLDPLLAAAVVVSWHPEHSEWTRG